MNRYLLCGTAWLGTAAWIAGSVTAEERPGRPPVVYQLGMRPDAAGPAEEDGWLVAGVKDLGDRFLRWAGGKETYNADDFANGIKNVDNFTTSPGGYAIGKGGEAASFAIGAGKTYVSYQDDKQRHAQLGGFTAATELSKWIGGTLSGGKVAAIILAGTAETPIVITIVVVGGTAWAVTSAVELTIEKIANVFFHPQAGALNTSHVGPVDPDVVEWLGTRAGGVRVINIRAPDVGAVRGVVLPEHFTPAEVRKVLEESQSNCLDRARELLGGLPSAFGPPPKEVSIDTLAVMIPAEIRTKSDLQKFVYEQARDAVDRRGLGTRTGQSDRAAQLKAYVDRSWPYIYRAWLKRQRRWAAELRNAVRSFAGKPLALTYVPDPGELQPVGEGKSEAVVQVTAQGGDLRSLQAVIRGITERLFGRATGFSLRNAWAWEGGGDGVTLLAPQGLSQKMTFQQEGTYLAVLRQDFVVRLPNGKSLESDRWAEVEIRVQSRQYPADLRGLWGGQLRINSIPPLEKLAAQPQDPLPSDPKELGCDLPIEIPPEMIEKIKAARFPLKLSITPQSVFAGRAVITVTRPDSLTPENEKGLNQDQTLPPMAYRYDNGVFLLNGTHQQATLELRGTFTRGDKAWRVDGTLQVFGEGQGKKILGATGTWTASRPDPPPPAKPAGKPVASAPAATRSRR